MDFFLIILIGALFGSFANVCIYRLPLEKSVVGGRSYCPKCKKKIIWYDNIPECNIYHIKFLIELSKYIGFYPNIINEQDMYFCLESGSTTNTKPIGININGVDLKLLKNLLGIEFKDLNSMSISKMSRVRILNYLIDYYSLHLQMFKTPKSINVFTQVFK